MGQSLILRCCGNCCILYCLISIISGKSVFLLCNGFSDIFRICFTQMLDRTLERLYEDIQGNGIQVIAELQQHPLWCFLSMVQPHLPPLPLSTYPNKKKKDIQGIKMEKQICALVVFAKGCFRSNSLKEFLICFIV